MTLSTKPEVHNNSQRCQWNTEHARNFCEDRSCGLPDVVFMDDVVPIMGPVLTLRYGSSIAAMLCTGYHPRCVVSSASCSIRQWAPLSWHSTAPTRTPTLTSWSKSSRGSSRECRRVVQLATGITSGNRACRRGSSRGCPCRCRCRRRGIPALLDESFVRKGWRVGEVCGARSSRY